MSHKQIKSSRHIFLFMIVLFCIWCAVFYTFITFWAPLQRDAFSYFYHIQYFVTGLSKGTFPFWSHLWEYGLPNDFFLRRFNDLNPLYLVLVLFYKIGLPFPPVYMVFQILYFFIGTVFFFLLAKKIFKNNVLAYIAFSALLFSSMGTQIFNSFIILVFTPMTGFFYFLVSFTEKTKKQHLIGAVFCLMILLSTYIPFYFLTIFLTFLISFIIVYWHKFCLILKKYLAFIVKHKLLSLICIFLIIASLTPGVLMLLSGKSELALAVRHGAVSDTNVLQVTEQSVSAGGIVLPFIVENMFTNFLHISLDRIYIPAFIIICFFAGIFNRLKRQHIFWALWIVLIYMIGLNNATPVYPFLYKHVFFFKLFRNSIFFTWLGLLPLIILFGTSLARQIIFYDSEDQKKKIYHIISTTLGFFTFIFFLTSIDNVNWLLFICSILIFLLLISCILKKLHPHKPIFLTLFSLLIIIPALNPYLHLSQNYQRKQRINYPPLNLDFSYKRSIDINDKLVTYVATRSVNRMYAHITPSIFKNYANHLIFIYDNTQLITPGFNNFSAIEKSMQNFSNIAFVESKDTNNRLINPSAPANANVITEDSKEFSVIDFSPNYITFTTDFPSEKFIIYTDSYHKDWKAYINGQETEILRSNLSFKGVLAPAGQNTITLRYINPQLMGLKIILWIIFICTLGYYIHCCRRKRHDA